MHTFNLSSNIATKNMIIKNFRDYSLFVNEFILFDNVLINVRIDDFIIIKFLDVKKSVKWLNENWFIEFDKKKNIKIMRMSLKYAIKMYVFEDNVDCHDYIAFND